MNPIKPGTRCECRDCPELSHDTRANGDLQCAADAVRLVTVRACVKDYAEKYPIQWNELTAGQRAYVLAQPNTIMETSDIPMCASCAAYHESKGV